MRSRKLLAFILCLVTGPALAGYMTLLGAGLGAIQPVAQATFTNSSYSTNLSNLTSIATFSRAGFATQFDSSGYLTYGPNNLLTYSNTFSNAAWTKASVTITSGVTDPLDGTNAFTLTATGANGQVYQPVSVSNGTGTNFIQSIWIRRRAGSGTVSIYKPDGTTQVVVAIDSTWKQFSAVGVGLATIAYNTVLLATSGDAVDIYGATLSAVTYETTPRTQDQVITTSAAYYGPRFDYTYNGSSWVPAGLLIEGAATNLNIQSGPLTTSWTVSEVSRTANAALASDGVTQASKFTPTAGTGLVQFYTTPYTVPASATYTNSIEIDGSSGAYPVLVFLSGTNSASAVFDVTTNADGVATQSGTTGTGMAVLSTSQKYLGGGRYRLSMTATVAAGVTYCYYGMTPNKTGNTFAVNSGLVQATWAGTEYIIASLSQFEAGNLSSYTPTGASAVTRPAETVQLTGTALSTLQGASGTAIVQTTDAPASPSASEALIGSNAVANMFMRYAPGPNISSLASDSTALNASGSPTFTSPIRTGVAWGPSSRSLVYNGGAVATDAKTFSGVTTAWLGVANGGAQYWLNGHIASFALYNSRLPDATLQAKSVVGAAY